MSLDSSGSSYTGSGNPDINEAGACLDFNIRRGLFHSVDIGDIGGQKGI